MAALPLDAAWANRSIRVIKTELEFLRETGVINATQFTNIVASLPDARPMSQAPIGGTAPALPPVQVPQQQQTEFKNEKQGTGYYAGVSPAETQAPHAYPSVPPPPTGPPVLGHATAQYQYNAQDAGDLALMPNDRVAITEFMNQDWWRGKNERTGQEGIFPRAYVKMEEKAIVPSGPQPSSYGNMELDVANGVGSNKQPSKGEEAGKKFGKKLGNAAIFGAGATIGGKIVNGIF